MNAVDPISPGTNLIRETLNPFCGILIRPECQMITQSHICGRVIIIYQMTVKQILNALPVLAVEHPFPYLLIRGCSYHGMKQQGVWKVSILLFVLQIFLEKLFELVRSFFNGPDPETIAGKGEITAVAVYFQPKFRIFPTCARPRNGILPFVIMWTPLPLGEYSV